MSASVALLARVWRQDGRTYLAARSIAAAVSAGRVPASPWRSLIEASCPAWSAAAAAFDAAWDRELAARPELREEEE
jgi:hypothetical protein